MATSAKPSKGRTGRSERRRAPALARRPDFPPWTGGYLMLTIWGAKGPGFGTGMSRRRFLQIGSLGFGGLSLADLLQLRASGAIPAERRRKAVIMVYLFGGPSHIDMYDLKPDAPAEIRGEFK